MKHTGFIVRYTMRESKINDYHTIANQIKTFDAIFGKEVITKSDIKLNAYFSRNHLVPHADLPSEEFKKLTYYYHNSYPGKAISQIENEH